MKFNLKRVAPIYYKCEVYISGLVPTESLTSIKQLEMLLEETLHLAGELREAIDDSK